MLSQKESILIITHDGWKYHPDEIVGCANLLVYYSSQRIPVVIQRSRERRKLILADHLVDVGGKNDEKNFDHHKGIGGMRPNGVPYASAGLTWKFVGPKLCSNDTVFQKFDKEFIEPIDAWDNGGRIYWGKKAMFSFFDIVSSMRGQHLSSSESDKNFIYLVHLAAKVIRGKLLDFEKKYGVKKIQYTFAWITNTPIEKMLPTFPPQRENLAELEKKQAPAGQQSEVLDTSEAAQVRIIKGTTMIEEVFANHPETLFVVYPSNDKESQWIIRPLKRLFPYAWRGIARLKLQKLIGTNDVLSCRKDGTIATATCRDGALLIAREAIRQAALIAA